MDFKKGVLIALAIALAAFFADAQQGFCANPIIPASQLCLQGIELSACCPGSSQAYGTAGFPQSQQDCQSSYFSASSAPIGKCNIVCCYDDLSPRCEPTLNISCIADGNQASASATCTQSGGLPPADLPVCANGCCCYQEGSNTVSEMTSMGYCEAKGDDMVDFNDTITADPECTAYCGSLQSSGPGGTTEDPQDAQTECNDNIDNDGDGKVDSDGNGNPALADSCCLLPTTPSESCAQDHPSCPAGASVQTACNCLGTTCAAGSYCCGQGCSSLPCSQTCYHDVPCGQFNNGCPLFRVCQPDGTLSACMPRANCGITNEVCNNNLDDNSDGYKNCEDVFCDGVICAGSDAMLPNCVSRGYYSFVDSSYRCCSTLELNDCDETSGMDTCGPCDCLRNRRAPILDDIRTTRGTNEARISWRLDCPGTTFNLFKCEGACTDPLDYRLVSGGIVATSFMDSGILPQTKYCYRVDSAYPASTPGMDNIYSSEVKCFTSGHPLCMQIPDDNFCTDEASRFDGKLVVRVKCHPNNSLEMIQYCADNQICIGPISSSGQTLCTQESLCQECGTPFDMYARFDTSSLSSGLCRNTETCYYENTNTTIDHFSGCENIQTCHDYMSEDACTGQGGTTPSNNKCLYRNCEWLPLSGSFGQGVCIEELEHFNRCGYCNENEHNSIFGACTIEKCLRYGDCFLRASGECAATGRIACHDYTTAQDCFGGSPLQIDVAYDANEARTSGSHRVLARSGDRLGLGLCRWDPTRYPETPCYKDADGNLRIDVTGDAAYDLTPPSTIITTPQRSRTLNITFIVSDFGEDGREGVGVHDQHVYFCKTRFGEPPCYPGLTVINNPGEINGQRGWIDLGAGIGKFSIYHYAMDKANNLEEVQRYDLEIDFTPPVIDISYSIQLDTQSFIDSKVFFTITADEDVRCIDAFEGTTDNQLRNNIWNQRFQTQYGGLSDGYYDYRVECTDGAGNSATKIVTVRIDADPFIFYTSPEGKINFSDIMLVVKTMESAACRWDFTSANYEQMRNNFGPAQTEAGAQSTYYNYTSQHSLNDGSRRYSFYVKCRGSSRTSSDEIQFVYDSIAPQTSIIDVEGETFDLSAFYRSGSLPDRLFLRCKDSPENGFGCNSTYYCIDYQNNVCNPQATLLAQQPIPFQETENDHLRLCYRSKENLLRRMGGLYEDTICSEFQLDTEPPSLITNLDAYQTREQPKVVHEDVFSFIAEVHDPDAVNDIPRNMVTISVLHTDAGGETAYDPALASPRLEKNLTLAPGLNTIDVIVADRSGAPATGVYFIFFEPYEGDRIFLNKPFYGVSGSRQFDLEVKTIGAAAECRYAFFNNRNSATPLLHHLDGASHFYSAPLDLSHLAENAQHQVFVFCRFGESVWEQRSFNLSWDSTRPAIESIRLERANTDNPPALIEFPLESPLTVVTDDPSRCKYTENGDAAFDDNSMIKFPGYDAGIFNRTNTIALRNLVDARTYTLYVWCENAAMRRAERARFVFKVDTSRNTGIRVMFPTRPINYTSFIIKIETNRISQSCSIGKSRQNLSEMSKITDYRFESESQSPAEGVHTYHIRCLTAAEVVDDSFRVTVDRSPPVMEFVDDGTNTQSLDAISASWKATDNITQVVKYSYAVGSFRGGADIGNWTNTSQRHATVQTNLTLGATYFWQVKALNEVDLWSEPMPSNGTIADPDFVPSPPAIISLCANGIRESNETDIDCGGVCSGCSANKTCLIGNDCASRACIQGKCALPTCNDSLKNQGESDIDCGGTCDGCALNATCITDDDCQSSYCSIYDTCAEPSCDDHIRNGLEEGVDCGGICTECEFSEHNETPGEILETGCTIESGDDQGEPDTDCDQMPDYWENNYDNTNTYSADADLDIDEDGMTNYEEYLNKTNPDVADSGPGMWIYLLIMGILLSASVALFFFHDKLPMQIQKYLGFLKPVKTQRTTLDRPSILHEPSLPPAPPGEPDNAKELIKAVRDKRKTAERKKLVSSFEPEVKDKKKELLKRVEQAFKVDKK